MARKSSKQHICEECGESFGHGISLRRHQRKTGHTGSKVVDEEEGGDSEEEEQPQQASEPEPEPEPEAEPEPEQAPEEEETDYQQQDEEEEEESPTVPSPTLPPIAARAEPPGGGSSSPRIDTKKLSILGHALSFLAAHHARRAKDWASSSAKSTAPVLAESIKLAAVILLALTIPVTAYMMYRGQRRARPQPPTYSSQIAQISEAKAAVLGFYQAIDQGNLNEAYELLSKGWQREISYEDFRDGFRNARSVGCRIENISALDENQVQVEFALEMQEDGTPKNYQGNYVVVRTSSGWRIDRGELKLTRSEGYRCSFAIALASE